jgi:peroxiredoxin Q/BCP
MHETRCYFAFALAVGLAGCGLHPPPAVGVSAPAFTLPNEEYKPVSLSDYHGKWVVIYFYRYDFDQRSIAEARAYQRDLPKFDEANAVVLGIGSSGVLAHKDFAEKEKLQFALLSDPELRVTRLYGALSRRLLVHTAVAHNVVIVDPQGKVAGMLPDFDANNPSGRVLTALVALQHQ